MNVFNNNTKIDDIKYIISNIDNTPIEYNFVFVNKTTKNNIIFLIKELFNKYNIIYYENDIIDILMELISNAIKAVYSNIIVTEDLKEKYIEYKDKIDSKEYIYDENIMNKYYEMINEDEYKIKLRKFIRVENSLLKDIDNNIDISKNEKYSRLLPYRKNNEEKFTIKLIVEIVNNHIKFTVINNSPLIKTNKNRIEKKREVFKDYYSKGLVDNFFLEQLDNTESAGFGLAICDLKLYNNNIAPYDHLKIFDLGNKTHSVLIIPIM